MAVLDFRVKPELRLELFEDVPVTVLALLALSSSLVTLCTTQLLGLRLRAVGPMIGNNFFHYSVYLHYIAVGPSCSGYLPTNRGMNDSKLTYGI